MEAWLGFKNQYSKIDGFLGTHVTYTNKATFYGQPMANYPTRRHTLFANLHYSLSWHPFSIIFISKLTGQSYTVCASSASTLKDVTVMHFQLLSNECNDKKLCSIAFLTHILVMNVFESCTKLKVWVQFTPDRNWSKSF